MEAQASKTAQLIKDMKDAIAKEVEKAKKEDKAVNERVIVDKIKSNNAELQRSSSISEYIKVTLDFCQYYFGHIDVATNHEKKDNFDIRYRLLTIVHQLPSQYLVPHKDTIFSMLFTIVERDNEHMQSVAVIKLQDLFKSFKTVEGIENNLLKFLDIINNRFHRFSEIVGKAFSLDFYTTNTIFNQVYNDEISARELYKKYAEEIEKHKNDAVTDQRLIQQFNEAQKKSHQLLDEMRKYVATNPDKTFPDASSSIKMLSTFANVIRTLYSTFRNKDLSASIQLTVEFCLKSLDCRVQDISKMCFRIKYNDYLDTLTKILQLLLLFCKKGQDTLHRSAPSIVKCTVSLLKEIAPDNTQNIKIVLTGLRHLLDIEQFRDNYFPYFDSLIDQLLNFTGTACRQIAYNEAYDLANRFLNKISLSQILSVIQKFSTCINDPMVPLNSVIRFLPMMSSYCDYITKSGGNDNIHLYNDNSHPDINRVFIQTFEAIVYKIAYLKRHIPHIFKAEVIRNVEIINNNNGSTLRQFERLSSSENDVITLPATDAFDYVPPGYGNYITERVIEDSFKEVKHLLYHSCLLLKSLLKIAEKFSDKNIPHATLNEYELTLLVSICKDILICLSILSEKKIFSGDEKQALMFAFADSLRSLSLNNILVVFDKIMPTLFDVLCKDVSFITIILRLYADNYLRSILMVVFEHIIERIDVFADSAVENQGIYTIFHKIFQSSSQNNSILLEETLSVFIYRLLKSIFTSTKNPSFYYNVLYTLSGSVKNCSETIICDYRDFAKYVLLELTRLSDFNNNNPILTNLLLDICLSLPLKLAQNTSSMTHFLYLMLKSLQSEYSDTFPAINSFTYLLLSYSTKFLYPYLLQEPQFTALLTACSDVTRSNERSRSTEFIYSILGRLGGNVRKIFDNLVELPMKRTLDTDIKLLLSWKSNFHICALPIDDIIERFYNTISHHELTTFTTQNLVKTTNKIPPGKMQCLLPILYRKEVFNLCISIAYLLFPNNYGDNNNNNLNLRTIQPKSKLLRFDEKLIIKKFQSNHHLVYKLFRILFILLHDVDINNDEENIINSMKYLTRHILLIYYSKLIDTKSSNFVPDGDIYNSSNSSFVYPSDEREKASKGLYEYPPVLPSLRYTYPKYIDSLSIFTINEAFVNSLYLLFNSENNNNYHNSYSYLDYITDVFESMKAIESVNILTVFGHFIEDLTIKLSNTCSSKNMELVYGCIMILNRMIETLPDTYCLRYVMHLTRVFFSILETCPSECLCFIEKPAIDTFKQLLLKTRSYSNETSHLEDYTVEYEKLITDSFNALLYYLTNPSKLCRKFAQTIFEYHMRHNSLLPENIREQLYSKMAQSFNTYHSQGSQIIWISDIYTKLGYLEGLISLYSTKYRLIDNKNTLLSVFEFYKRDTINFLPENISTEKQLIMCNMEAVKSTTSRYNPISPFSDLVIVEYRKQVLNLCRLIWKLYNEIDSKIINSILDLCIQSLGCINESVVEVADSVLTDMQKDYSRLKNTLFEVLGPVLTKLSDSASLTHKSLQTLKYILKIFKTAFSTDLSKRIVTHLEFWVNKSITTQIARTPAEKNIITILADLIEIFSLTPDNNAKNFQEKVVNAIITLEANLFPNTDHFSFIKSPLRLSLVKCCNVYPEDFKEYLLNDHFLNNSSYILLFYEILAHPEAQPFRNEFEKEGTLLKVLSLYSSRSKPNIDFIYHTIRIINILVSSSPDCKLFENQNYHKIMDTLLKPWQGRSLWNVPAGPRVACTTIEQPKLIVDTLLLFLHHEIADLNVVWLFEICRCFTHKSIVDFSYVAEFLAEYVPEKFSTELKTHIMQYFVSKLLPQNNLDDVKTSAFKYLITPLLARSFNQLYGNNNKYNIDNNNSNINNNNSNQINNNLNLNNNINTVNTVNNVNNNNSNNNPVAQNPPQQSPPPLPPIMCSAYLNSLLSLITNESSFNKYSEKLRIEMLKFITLLLERVPDFYLSDHRKSIIKFAWNHLKVDDSESRSWAFFCVSRFFQKFPSPERIVSQVFEAILKPNPSDPQGMIYKAYHQIIQKVQFVERDRKIAHVVRELDDYSELNTFHVWKLITFYPQKYAPYFLELAKTIFTSINLLFPKGSTESKLLTINIFDFYITCVLKDYEEKTGKSIDGEDLSREKDNNNNNSNGNEMEEDDDNSSNYSSQIRPILIQNNNNINSNNNSVTPSSALVSPISIPSLKNTPKSIEPSPVVSVDQTINQFIEIQQVAPPPPPPPPPQSQGQGSSSTASTPSTILSLQSPQQSPTPSFAISIGSNNNIPLQTQQQNQQQNQQGEYGDMGRLDDNASQQSKRKRSDESVQSKRQKKLSYVELINSSSVLSLHRDKLFLILVQLTLYVSLSDQRQIERCIDLIKRFLLLFPNVNIQYINLLDPQESEMLLRTLLYAINVDKDKKYRIDQMKMVYLRIAFCCMTSITNQFYNLYNRGVYELCKSTLKDKEGQSRFLKFSESFSGEFFPKYKLDQQRYHDLGEEIVSYFTLSFKSAYEEVRKLNETKTKSTKFPSYYVITRLKYIVIYYPEFIDQFFKVSMSLADILDQYVQKVPMNVKQTQRAESISNYYKFLEKYFSCPYIASLSFIFYVYSLRFPYLSAEDQKIYYDRLFVSLNRVRIPQYTNYLIVLLYNIVTGYHIHIIDNSVNDLTDERIGWLLSSIGDKINDPLKVDDAKSTTADTLKRIINYLLQYSTYTNIYLNLVFQIMLYYCYSYRNAPRSSILPYIEVGITLSEMKLKYYFLELFNLFVPKDIYSRLEYLFTTSTSHYIVKKNWIEFGGIILVDSLNDEMILKWCKESVLFPLIENGESDNNRLNDIIINNIQKFEDDFNNSKNRIINTKQFINSLLEIITFDPFVCDIIFRVLFKSAYESLDYNDKNKIANLINRFVMMILPIQTFPANNVVSFYGVINAEKNEVRNSQYFESKSKYISLPSPFKTILSVINEMEENIPVLYPKCIQSLINSTECYTVIIELLEKYLLLESIEIEEKNEYKKLISTIHHCMQDVDEEIGDLSSKTDDQLLKQALYYEQKEEYVEAQQVYYQILTNYKNNNNPYNNNEIVQTTKVAENRWIECSKMLRQWELLNNYSLETNDILLQIECQYRLQHYEEVIRLYEDPASVPSLTLSNQLSFIPYFISSAYYTKIKEKSKSQLSNLKARVYSKWKMSESILTPILSPILNLSQLLLEFTEAPEESNKKPADLMNYVNTTWYFQNPSKSDSLLLLWDNLYTWRKTFLDYLQVTDNNNNEKSFPLEMKNVWLDIKLANISRKQKHYITAATYLNEIENMRVTEINDLYVKIKNKCYLFLHDNQLEQGKELLDNLPKGLFSKKYQSNFEYLKILFYLKIEEKHRRNVTLESISRLCTNGLQMYNENSKLWCEWGKTYDNCYMRGISSQQQQQIQVQQQQQMLNSLPLSSQQQQQQQLYKYKEIEDFAFQAIVCYFHALKNDPEKYQLYLGRIFFLMSKIETVKRESELYKLITLIPHWLWIKYIHHYFYLLKNKENDYSFNILFCIAKTYPQLIIPSIRLATCLFKMKKAQVQQQQQQTLPLNISKKILTNYTNKIESLNGFIRKSANHEYSAITLIYEECYSKFATIHIVHAISYLQNHIELLLKSGNLTQPMNNLVATNLSKLCEKICREIFANNPILSSLQNEFYHDFISSYNNNNNNNNSNIATPLPSDNVSNINFPRTTLEAIERLYKWIDIIHNLAITQNEGPMLLSQVSHYFSTFREPGIEMLGCYTKMDDISVHISDKPPQLIGFHEIIHIINRNSIPYRVLTLLSDKGQSMNMYVKCVNNYQYYNESDIKDRIINMMGILNIALKENTYANNRHIKYNIKITIPISPGLFLVEDDVTNISLLDIYNLSNSGNRPKNIEMIQRFSETVCNEMDLEIRKDNYGKVFALCGSNILKDYIIKNSISTDYYYVFHQQFVKEYALHSYFSYVFCIETGTAETLLFSQSNGSIYNSLNLSPKYDISNKNFSLKNNSPIKFRLTPNILEFIGEKSLTGTFISVLNGLSESVNSNSFPLNGFMNIYENEILYTINSGYKSVEIKRDLSDEEIDNLHKEVKAVADRNQERINKRINKVKNDVFNLISKSIDPINIAQMDIITCPWI